MLLGRQSIQIIQMNSTVEITMTESGDTMASKLNNKKIQTYITTMFTLSSYYKGTEGYVCVREMHFAPTPSPTGPQSATPLRKER